MTSLYKQHVEKWKDCIGCDSCNFRRRVVLFRGSVPCDVLFIGEAPGPSEDAIGQPFVGPAGKLLDAIIEKAREGYTVKIGMTNVVACIPKGEDNNKFLEPPEESIKACHQRLSEIISICRPKLLVTVGKIADKWMRASFGIKQVTITHPAAIIRSDESQQPLAIKRCIVTLSDALEEIFQ